MRLLPLRRPRPEAPPAAAAARARRETAHVPAHEGPDDRPAGCGWCDSSHELLSGVRVTEHAEADAVVNLVPLSWWLAWELDAALARAR
jgi:hypothetical protein